MSLQKPVNDFETLCLLLFGGDWQASTVRGVEFWQLSFLLGFIKSEKQQTLCPLLDREANKLPAYTFLFIWMHL